MRGNEINVGITTGEMLIEQGYRKYEGKDVDIYYNKEICIHAGKCTHGAPDVFKVQRRPWVLPDNGSSDNVIKVIDSCPSGALKYVTKSK
ncbi:MAG: (4Fe-4S)-binding protein [Clostridioides sp.]|jgi:uncharacterized Fe-S cluster protein YjdI|nr:(4Fe-4S)-binding protein [Clostridioides sp.]